MTKEKGTSILVAENTEKSNGPLRQILVQMGIDTRACSDGIDALKEASAWQPDVIIADVWLPRLNGFQLARLAKNDPLLKHIPIILMASKENRDYRDWSRSCGADAYVRKPKNETEVAESIAKFIDTKTENRKTPDSSRVLTHLDDGAILTMANNLMERELIWMNRLTELSVLAVSDKTRSDLVTAYMNLFGSLFEFSFGAVLFLEKHRGEFFFYHDGQIEQNHILQAKVNLLDHLAREYCLLLDSENIRIKQLTSPCLLIPLKDSETLWVHTSDNAQTHAVLAFENSICDSLDENRKRVFDFTMDVGINLFEKKIWQETFQESSIIDAVTDGYSAAFFMECLNREVEDAVRHDYPLTLFTIVITNFKEITKQLTAEQTAGLIRSIQNIILTIMRKSDIVARFETTYFAFLLRYVPLEKAQVARKRIIAYIQKRLAKYLSPSVEVTVETGIRQFDPEQDRAPEVFLARAQPE
jgi:twitching motility two-component system response regulator PilH